MLLKSCAGHVSELLKLTLIKIGWIFAEEIEEPGPPPKFNNRAIFISSCRRTAAMNGGFFIIKEL